MSGLARDAAKGHWVKEEAAVDSGSVDPVLNKSKFPHLEVHATPESSRGEAWTGAGGQKIAKEGQVNLDRVTDGGALKRTKFKVGAVGRTLISVSRLNENGYDAQLRRLNPCIVNFTTGERIPLKRSGGMFLLTMWIWVPASKGENSGFPGQP